MAKAALEMAVMGEQLRAQHMSFTAYIGAAGTSVPSGVSVGIQNSIDQRRG